MSFNPVITPGGGWYAIVQQNTAFNYVPVVLWYLSPNGNVEGLTPQLNSADLTTVSSLGTCRTYVPSLEAAQNVVGQYKTGLIK